MGKEKAAVHNSFVRELSRAGVYKRSQGRVARQVTFAALAVAMTLGCYQLMQYLGESAPGTVKSVAGLVNYEMSNDGAKTAGRWIEYSVPGFLWFVSTWIGYRLVNYQRFADFLIAVEAEMNKVSWPSRAELFRSSLVVILVIFVLAAVLFAFDFFWASLFDWLRIIPKKT